MSSAISTPNASPALIIFDERALGATMTATSQAGPRAGVPEPTRATAAVLEASGDLDEGAAASVVVTAREAGGVGRGTWTWAADGGSEMSHDPPLVLTDAAFIHRSTVADAWRRPCVRRRPNGLAVASVTASGDTCKVMVEDSPGDWSTSTIEDVGTASVSAVLVDGDGVIRVYYTVDVSYTTDATQVRMAYSTDDGATWDTGSTAALVEPIAYPGSYVQRIRVAESAGQVVLFVWIHDGTDYLLQYASTDNGATFDLVEEVSTTDVGAPDVVAWGGAFYVGTVRYTDGGTLHPWLQVLAAAGQPLSTADLVEVAIGGDSAAWATRSGSLLTAADCAVVVDDDGRVWVYGTDHGGDQETIARVSADGGTTWLKPYTPIHDSGDASTYLRDVSVCPGRGRAVLLSTYVGSPSTADDSVVLAYLGGWTSIAMPETTGWQQPTAVGGWERVYLPLDYPTDVGYTETATGSAVIGAGGLAVTNTAGQLVIWSIDPGVGVGREEYGGIISLAALCQTDTVLRIDAIWSDGAHDYSARLELVVNGLGDATLSLDDLNGAGAATLDLDFSTEIEVRLAILPASGFTGDAGVATAYARLAGDPARAWERLELTGLVRGTAVAQAIRVGVREADADVHWWAWTGGDEMPVADPAQEPTRGRAWCSTASPAHVRDGIALGMADGPAQSGDSWTVATAYAYPVEALDPSVSPSPSRTWRATTDDQQDIVITSEIGWRAGDLVAFVLLGANWRTGAIYADDTGSTKIADVDLSGGNAGLPYTRTKNAMWPKSDGGAEQMTFHPVEDELVGARVAFGGMSRPVRLVAGSWSGAWLNSSPDGYKSARLRLEDFAPADPTTGDDLAFWFPGAVIITTIMESTDTIMLRIDTETTREGYLQLGTFAVGRVALLAHPYDASRVRGRASGTEITTLPGGGRASRVLHRPRRMVDVSWDDGVITQGIHSGAAAPDYLATGIHVGAKPTATRPETADLVDGIFAQVKGGHRPLVYVAAVPRILEAITDSTPTTIVQPSRWMYGRITTEEMRLDTVRGDEHSTTKPEVVRVATIRIEEEL